MPPKIRTDMKLQNYELTETGGALILKTKYSIAPMLKGLTFAFFVLAALLFALKFSENDSGFFWMLAIFVAYTVIALVIVFVQYRRLALRKYPIFTIDEKCVSEFWVDEMGNPRSKEIRWADLKCYSEFFVESGIRYVIMNDVILFSTAGDLDYETRHDKIKNIISGAESTRKFSEEPHGIYIVLESSDGEKLYSAISDFCSRRGIPDPKKFKGERK